MGCSVPPSVPERRIDQRPGSAVDGIVIVTLNVFPFDTDCDPFGLTVMLGASEQAEETSPGS